MKYEEKIGYVGVFSGRETRQLAQIQISSVLCVVQYDIQYWSPTNTSPGNRKKKPTRLLNGKMEYNFILESNKTTLRSAPSGI